jgi:DNA modification methylase
MPMIKNSILCSDTKTFIKEMSNNSADLVCCSPPYAQKRNKEYSGIAAEEYPDWLFEISQELMRIIKDSGSFVLNIKEGTLDGKKQTYVLEYLLKMAKAGWWTETFIWCLSGGTELYSKEDDNVRVANIKDICRSFLGGHKIELWNGNKWTKIIGAKKNPAPKPLIITLKSGERIVCTKEHLWPTTKGNVRAENLMVGDCLTSTVLPEPETENICLFENELIGWFIGIYLAEGSFSKGGKELQFSIHKKEKHIFSKIEKVAKMLDATCKGYNCKGDGFTVKVYGKVPIALINQYIAGNTSKRKFLSNYCWRKSNRFLNSILDGYLDGDGHYEKDNNRWRIGFTRNYQLEKSLRTICARLGYRIKIKMCINKYPYKGEIKYAKSFRGEIRKKIDRIRRVDYNKIESVKIFGGKDYWDLEVEDEPNVFALSSGILTHNCKTNAYPSGSKKRLKDGFEYCYQFTKTNGYKFFPNNVLVPANPKWVKNNLKRKNKGTHNVNNGSGMNMAVRTVSEFARPSNVITLATNTTNVSHPATFPIGLPDFFIKLMTEENDIVFDPFMGSGTTALACLQNNRSFFGIDNKQEYVDLANRRIEKWTKEQQKNF